MAKNRLEKFIEFLEDLKHRRTFVYHLHRCHDERDYRSFRVKPKKNTLHPDTSSSDRDADNTSDPEPHHSRRSKSFSHPSSSRWQKYGRENDQHWTG